jgi:hypothetical protein
MQLNKHREIVQKVAGIKLSSDREGTGAPTWRSVELNSLERESP